MAVSSITRSTAATALPAPQKASATAPVDTPKTASKDSRAGEAAPSANFNVKLPPQPTSNALGHTIGQHLNLQA